MKTLNKSKLITVVKEYNSNNSNSCISFLSGSATVTPRLQYYNYHREDISLK